MEMSERTTKTSFLCYKNKQYSNKRKIYHVLAIQGWLSMWKWINVTHHVTELKEENHVIISHTDEEASDKNPTPFPEKNTQQNWNYKGTAWTW